MAQLARRGRRLDLRSVELARAADGHNIDLRILEQGLYTGSRPRAGSAGHQGAHFGIDIHYMDDLQPVAKGRHGGKMNGLGDGTRSDYAYSKRLAHGPLSVGNTLVTQFVSWQPFPMDMDSKGPRGQRGTSSSN